MGVLLEMPSNGAVVWEDFPDIVQAQGKANMFVSLTNWTATTIPQVEAGSRVIVNGAMYKFTANETITDLAGAANSTDNWFKVVPAGATCTVVAVTVDGSTWSADKGGYYDGNDKYIGGCYKDSGGDYVQKWIYDAAGNQVRYANNGLRADGGIRTDGTLLKTKVIVIGVWDMNSTVGGSTDLTVAHTIVDWTKIRRISVIIRNDLDNKRYTGTQIQSTAKDIGVKEYTSTNIVLSNPTGGFFDSVSFDGGDNRGWIIITYEA